MNSGISVHTHYLEASLKGTIDLRIKKIRGVNMKSLEMELLSKGYSSMQNKLKHFLLRRQENHSDIAQQNFLPELSHQEAYQIINEVKTLCVARADAVENLTVTEALERHISYCFEEKERTTVTFYPRPETGTGDLMPTAIAQIGKELYNTDNLSSTQHRYINKLLTEKVKTPDSARNDLIKAAYRLGMTLDETNEFLTKAAFTYALDCTDQWELLAAYLITCEPIGDYESSSIFEKKMKTAEVLLQKVKNGNTSESTIQLQNFLLWIRDREYRRWVKEYHRQREQGQKAEFLLSWAWKLMVYKDSKYAKKSFYTKLSNIKQAEIDDQFSTQLARLKELAEALDRNNNVRDHTAVMDDIACCMQDRRRHLLDLIYSLADRDDIDKVVLGGNGEDFFPPFKEYGFTKLDRALQKIASPDRSISRSDIISLGIELGFSWEQFDLALEIGGFYKLYVKDLHEQALAAVLATGPVTEPEQILVQLQQRYDALSKLLRNRMGKSEPAWIRRIKDDFSSSEEHH